MEVESDLDDFGFEDKQTASMSYAANLNDMQEQRLNHLMRTQQDDGYSEDDHTFLNLFPDSSEAKYMELTYKILQENKRKSVMN